MGLTDSSAQNLAPADLGPVETPQDLLEQRGFFVSSIDSLYNLSLIHI